MKKRPLLIALLAAAALSLAALAQDRPIDAGPYVASPDSAVAAMLREADVGPDDYVIDLGSGDGRIVRTAAAVFGARGMGVEIQEPLVALSNALARKEGIADRAQFVTQDLFKTDISRATVVTMYLLPHTVNRLQGKLLAELRPGARVVSHDYAISGVTRTVIYVYVIPARVAGTWSASVPATVSKGPMRLELKQQLSQVGGEVRLDGRAVPLVDARLVGEALSFRLAGRDAVFRGTVSGGTIEGTVESGGVRAPWRATLGG
jgi:hypothetical protein